MPATMEKLVTQCGNRDGLRPTTHAPETGAINPLYFLARVSCKSLTEFFWYQILVPIKTLFYSKPESGIHLTEMMTCDLVDIDVFMCC